ncbi:MAG: hypothetical protein AB7H43_03410 [Acidimicrobiia bacterium]
MDWRRALAVLGLVALLAAGCGSDDDSDAATTDRGSDDGGTTGGGGGDGSGADPYDDPGTTSTTAGGGAASASVSVATHARLGAILVGPDGHTLYLFEKDTGTTSACSGACLDTWPPLRVASPTAGAGVDPAKLTTAGGQVVYNGHLLYSFAPDKAPGDVLGAAVPSWFAVNPSGDKIVPG